PPTSPNNHPVTLYGELSVNTVSAGDMVPLYEEDGRIYLRGKDLYAAGMSVPDDNELIAPSMLPGVFVNWNLSHLRFSVTCPSSLLRSQNVGLIQHDAQPELAPPLPGLILNYSTYATRVQSELTDNTWS